MKLNLPLEVINQFLKNDVLKLFKKDIESIGKFLLFVKSVSLHKRSFLTNMHDY